MVNNVRSIARLNTKAVLGIIIALLVIVTVHITTESGLLTLESLKKYRDALLNFKEAHPFLFISEFFVIYVVSVALSIPGATVLTLAAGAIFGFWQGLIIVSFASTIGATLAFLVSRYILGEEIQKRYGERLKTVNEHLKKEGLFYLFAMRLVPAIPFFIINIVMGLTNIKAKDFYWVSQLGMLPGTAVYVYAGTTLAEINSLSDIMSTKVIVAFSLLGISPILFRKMLSFIKKESS